MFQLAVGVWPQAFYPEILGMTLYLEWEATPTMMPPVRMLQRRGMNPLFYSLHMAIDNVSEGHGALAKEAVRIHLDEVREHGGDRAVAESWTRVWNGYVTWATIGSLGADLMARRLIIDGKTIDVGTPDEPKCFPDWKQHHRDRMVNLVGQKGRAVPGCTDARPSAVGCSTICSRRQRTWSTPSSRAGSSTSSGHGRAGSSS